MSAALQLVERHVDTEQLEHDQLVTVYAWDYRGRSGRWDFLGSEVLVAIRETFDLSSTTRIEVVIPEPGSHQAYGWGWRR